MLSGAVSAPTGRAAGGAVQADGRGCRRSGRGPGLRAGSWGLVFINTQLLQAALRDPVWADKLTEKDRQGLSSLFWSHVSPYGRFRLDMDTCLDLTAA